MFSHRKEKHKAALLLGGGGARAAYQVGVLKAVADIIPEGEENPFPIICGTSAGSINAAALASYASNFHMGVRKLHSVWSRFQLQHVFKVDSKSLFLRILSWAWSNLGWGRRDKAPTSLLDNQPLRRLLTSYINFERIEKSIHNKDLHAFCVNTCSYISGDSTTFYEGHESIVDWSRTHRTGIREDINIDHLMASSAIPVIFPAVQIDQEFYGDGSMRQNSPISPALHLGARKVFIIGVRMENAKEVEATGQTPSLGHISGYVLDTLFLNSLIADIERMDRINRTLDQIPKETTIDKLKKIDYLMISPSKDIAEIADRHFNELPKAFRSVLRLIGLKASNSRRFISYLMFIESYCQELIELGYQDAMLQKEDIKAFLQSNS